MRRSYNWSPASEGLGDHEGKWIITRRAHGKVRGIVKDWQEIISGVVKHSYVGKLLNFVGHWTAYSDQHLVVAADLGRGNFQWTQNKYYGGGDFSLEGKGLTFTDWRSTTKLDSDSSSSTTRPTVNWVFIRPNRYEPGRANITIYNWKLAQLVSVDVSQILTTGQRFEVRNARDFFGEPVLAGTYHGGAVSIPMTKLSGTEPYGTGVKSQKEGAREFGAFVLLSKRSISKATSP